MNNTMKLTKLLSLICTLCLMLSSCSSIYKYDHIPDTSDAKDTIDMSEEYFTTGEVISGAVGNLGIIYEGQWIYVESTKVQVEGSGTTVAERIVKYNPVTNTVSSVCLDPTCFHSSEECMLCAPYTWLVSNIDIFGNWMMYTFTNIFADEDDFDIRRTYLYNLKTGEARKLYINSKEDSIIKKISMSFEMKGKIYSTNRVLDYTGEEEYYAAADEDAPPFVPESHQFVEVYDPDNQKFERLFEISDDYLMVGITNKRIFFKDSAGCTWSVNHKGENLTEEKNMNFDFMMACGKYIYIPEEVDYLEKGYNLQGYDIVSETVFNVDYGCQIRKQVIESGKLCFTTMSNIDEYKRFVKNTIAYLQELYPDITDPYELVKHEQEVRNKLLYSGTLQIYVTDARGENKELIFEGEHMQFYPHRISDKYIFGKVTYGDPNKNYRPIKDTTDRRCVINIETGEITLIPQFEVMLNN